MPVISSCLRHSSGAKLRRPPSSAQCCRQTRLGQDIQTDVHREGTHRHVTWQQGPEQPPPPAHTSKKKTGQRRSGLRTPLPQSACCFTDMPTYARQAASPFIHGAKAQSSAPHKCQLNMLLSTQLLRRRLKHIFVLVRSAVGPVPACQLHIRKHPSRGRGQDWTDCLERRPHHAHQEGHLRMCTLSLLHDKAYNVCISSQPQLHPSCASVLRRRGRLGAYVTFSN